MDMIGHTVEVDKNYYAWLVEPDDWSKISTWTMTSNPSILGWEKAVWATEYFRKRGHDVRIVSIWKKHYKE